jgi:hypothetical protein
LSFAPPAITLPDLFAEIRMRVAWFGLLALSLTAAACGRGAPASSVTVTCGGATALVGAKYVNVVVDSAAKTTVLTFPDPLNSDQTGSITVDRRCTIAPTAPT